MGAYSSIASFIRSNVEVFPEVALVLGSGLGYLTDYFRTPVSIDYSDIDGFPRSTVEGHKGRLVFGDYCGKRVVALEGRFHFYEGHGIDDLAIPVYVFKELGVKNIIITNAAGGINRSFRPGDIVAITDIINFGFKNPLRGINKDEYGPRFPDMSDVVDSKWIERTRDRLSGLDIEVKEGTYLWVTGPCYETPAEIRAYEFLGGDLVGMSTVPEIIAAKHCGMRIIAYSCVTNMASGILKEKLSHSEVIETAKKVRSRFTKILEITLETM